MSAFHFRWIAAFVFAFVEAMEREDCKRMNDHQRLTKWIPRLCWVIIGIMLAILAVRNNW